MAERHRCQIDLMIDEMIDAGKSEQDILTAICKQYEPYDRFLEFGEGFVDYHGCHRLLPKDVWPATDAVSSMARSGHRTAGASIALPHGGCATFFPWARSPRKKKCAGISG
jgi:hypothetical protein